MGFSVKLAPGVRVRASSRGVRTSIGPRVARVHVGSGRTGFSTGVGPVSYYTSVGGSSRRSPGTRNGTSIGTATANRQLAAANRAAVKEQEAHQLADALTAIFNLHRADFEPARRPIAPAPPAVDTGAVRAAYVKQAKASTSVFSRAARKAAIAQARHRADSEVAATTAVYREQQAGWQESLDAQWAELNANAPDVVLAALAEAFEDNEAAAAAVGVDDAQVTLVVIVPGFDAVPERQPTVTAAGSLSLKKLTKRDRSDLYKLLVCGHVLVTLKEAFAVAPAIASARVIALRPAPTRANGRLRPDVVLAGVFERNRLKGVKWADADAVRVVMDTQTELILQQQGAAQELVPVDLSKEPQLQALVATVAFEDLMA